MDVVAIVASILHTAALVLFYILWARVILDFVRQVRRDWKPGGFWLVVSVTILTITDPILKVARKIVRPVRIGGAQVDFAMLAVMVVLLIAIWLLTALRH